MIVKTTCGPFKIVAWCFSYSIKRENLLKWFFFIGMIAFPFKRLCFQQPLKCYRNDLLTSKVVVRTLFGPSKIVLWAFLNSILRKKANIFFSLRKIAFFHKLALHQPLRSYKNRLLTCTTNVKRFFGPQKMFSDFCHVRYYEKKGAARFSSLESLLFVQNFVFSTTR